MYVINDSEIRQWTLNNTIWIIWLYHCDLHKNFTGNFLFITKKTMVPVKNLILLKLDTKTSLLLKLDFR